MIPIPFVDILEILPSEVFSFRQTGLEIPGASEDNLCIRAYNLMKQHYAIPPVYMHLRKEIPMGAGMGGGSADAAYVLKGINELFQLNRPSEELEDLAAQLGSDCPFFIKHEAQIARGRGEILSACQLDLAGYYLKIVNPGLHVGTKEAYDGISFSASEKSVVDLVEGPIEHWKELLKNDFEKSVFLKHPELASIKEKLYAEGAIYAAMSGSGSTMFGIYKNEPKRTFGENTTFLELIKRF